MDGIMTRHHEKLYEAGSPRDEGELGGLIREAGFENDRHFADWVNSFGECAAGRPPLSTVTIRTWRNGTRPAQPQVIALLKALAMLPARYRQTLLDLGIRQPAPDRGRKSERNAVDTE